jgi:hypothetical protein
MGRCNIMMARWFPGINRHSSVVAVAYAML